MAWVQDWNAAQWAAKRWMQLGWSFAQSCGIGGNIMQESVFDPTILGDKGTALGLAQWHDDRQQGLKDFAKGKGLDYKSLQAQVDYVDYELRHTEKGAGDKLKASSTIEDATAAVMAYERPVGYSSQNPKAGSGWNNRLNYANKLAGLLAAAKVTEELAASPTITPATPPQTKVKTLVDLVKSTPKGLVEYGDTGEVVQAVQKALATFKYPLTGTGNFMNATRVAVRDFQERVGIQVDGQVGPQTAQKILDYTGKTLPAPKNNTPDSPPLSTSIPLWLTFGLKLINVKETPGSANNPTILEWAKEEGGAIAQSYTADSIPWCALFANHCLTKAGYQGTETLWALDFEGKWPAINLKAPSVGAFAPMTRSGGGHIMIVVGRDKAGNVMGLSGNTSDKVSINAYPMSRLTHGFWWPKKATLPLAKNIGLSNLPIATTTGQLSTKES